MTKKEKVKNEIKENIISLNLKPGEFLSETELSKKYNLSRTPIRDILKSLSQENYIETYPKKGNMVSLIDLKSVEQVIYLRSMMEKQVIKEISGKLDLSSIHNLKVILTKQKKAIETDFESFLLFDDLFHIEIYKTASREFLWDIFSTFSVHYSRYRRLNMLKKEKLKEIQNDHEILVELLIKGETNKLEKLIDHHLKDDVNSAYFLDNFHAYVK